MCVCVCFTSSFSVHVLIPFKASKAAADRRFDRNGGVNFEVRKKSSAKNQGKFQGPPIMGPPYGKLPIPFPYLWGFLWEWYGNSMGSLP